MLDIRPPTEDNRDDLARIIGFAFNYQPQVGQIHLEGKLCAFDGNLLVGVAGSIPFGQWFGGRKLPCAGVASVAVSPEYRGRGAASRLMTQLLAHDREQGRSLSALYPANAPLYRKLGYEFGGLRPQLVASVADLPAGRADRVHEASPQQVPELMACFSRASAQHNGPVETDDSEYFSGRMLAFTSEGNHQRTVVVQGTDGIEGYASYFTGSQGPGSVRLTCKHFVPATPAALRSLLAYFARFQNSAKELAWCGPANDAVMGMALASNGFAIESGATRWMERVLDVPAALGGRGYPPVSGRATLVVADPIFPQNNGPWLIEAEDRKVRISPGEAPGARLSIGALSALYTGQASPADLLLTGALEAGAAELGFLGALFAGPAPWMPHFF